MIQYGVHQRSGTDTGCLLLFLAYVFLFFLHPWRVTIQSFFVQAFDLALACSRHITGAKAGWDGLQMSIKRTTSVC